METKICALFIALYGCTSAAPRLCTEVTGSCSCEPDDGTATGSADTTCDGSSVGAGFCCERADIDHCTCWSPRCVETSLGCTCSSTWRDGDVFVGFCTSADPSRVCCLRPAERGRPGACLCDVPSCAAGEMEVTSCAGTDIWGCAEPDEETVGSCNPPS